MELFGFQIKRKQVEENIPSIAPPVPDDGSIMSAAGGVYGSTLDLDGAVKSEAELITKYREAAQSPELQTAITKIINEAIVDDQDETVVKLVLDKLDYSEDFKRKIEEEFNTVLDLLEFTKYPYKIFENWYIDGRLYYHVMVDIKKPTEGIKELRYLDPRKIRKVREVKAKRGQSGVVSKEVVNEYYLYNDRAATIGKMSAGSPMSQTALKIAKDSILYVTSGLTNPTGNLVISYLQKALRPLNQLRSLEDSLVIYRISRAPERRIFYIDVGNLPKSKAEQYVRDLMVRFKNKLIYDAATGEIKDDRKFMTMLEDFWLPRKEGGKGTEITTLPGGQNLSQIDDIVYFQKNLYKALNVPVTRLDPEINYNLGRSSEISREEIEFSKFITRLRSQFAQLFTKALGTQLMLKNIVTPEDWDVIEGKIGYRFNKDNFWEELKESEILRDRLDILRTIDDYAGKYYSHSWIRKNILRQTDEEIHQMDKEIAEEQTNPQFNPPIEQPGQEQQSGPDQPE